MIEIIILAAITGTTIAGLWDLKTTEVPDQLPYIMIGFGIAFWLVDGVMTGVFTPLIYSLTIGSVLLAVGLILYRKGQWGGADAWILAAIGYMIPLYSGVLFIIPYIMNFIVVSLFYTVIYAIAVGFLHPKSFKLFRKDVAKNVKLLLIGPACLAGVIAAFLITGSVLIFPMIFLFSFLSVMLVFWRYALVLEKNVFRKKVKVSKLRKGDVLEKGNWIGLTEKDIRKMKKSGYVTIKDGIRFVPVFAIALVITLLCGNLFLLIF
jgi:Flp pilus assembly protein protease CpaA